MVLVLAAALAAAASPSQAFFERLAVSSRVHAMGGAFVSVSDDPAAVVLNPAGLAQIRSPSVLSTISEPYGVSDLGEYFFSAAVPTRVGTIGLSWHRFGLDGAVAEHLFTLAFGRDLVRTLDASLSVGAALDIAHVGYPDEGISATGVAGALSMFLRPFPFIGAGYTVRNVGEPELDFGLPEPASGGEDVGSTRLQMTHTFGFAYHWEKTFSVLYERERGQDGVWRDRLGLEVQAGQLLRLRSGLVGSDVTGGLGVTFSNVTIDAGVASHEVLGLSYIVSVGIALPIADEGEEDEW
jgi:hypothetical protein